MLVYTGSIKELVQAIPKIGININILVTLGFREQLLACIAP